MSDVDSLLDAFATGELLRPTPGVPNIIDLSRALAFLAGGKEIQSTPSSSALADLIGPSDHLVFILADGLGINLIEELADHSFLRTHLAAELRTVFPSSTPVGLTSFATGEWPARHAVTGWWTHLQEIGSATTILHFVTRSHRRSLTSLGVTPEQAFPAPSVMRGMRRDTLALFPERIADGVYSTYFSGNRAKRGYRSFREAADIVSSRVQDANQPTYTYLYSRRIDSAAHLHGVGNRDVKACVLELERALEQLKNRLGDNVRIVLSADHGFFGCSEGEKHQIKMSDPLMASLLHPPSGDARVLYLHVREGSQSKVRKYFKKQFGERFLLLDVDQAEDLELFGPGDLSSATKGRLGNLIAISRGADVIEYRPNTGAGRVMSEASHHSGLTPSEMRVPLVIA